MTLPRPWRTRRNAGGRRVAEMRPAATFSPCRTYRYTLWREWLLGEGYAMIVGLNPSTADETVNDPTVRRCMEFAKAWGFRGLCMTNVFAFRATLPADMKRATDPVGPDNDRALLASAQSAGVVVAAWGTHGAYRQRDVEVCALLPHLHALQITKHGCPNHPLYLKKTLTPRPWAR